MRIVPPGARTALALIVSLALFAPIAGAQNVALGKNAFQSSTYAPGWSDAWKAVDGDTQGNYFAANGIATTQAELNAWWYVDLGGTYSISSITVWNRTDCCDTRLSDFFVSVLAAGTPNIGSLGAPTTWSSLFNGPAGVSETFNAGGASGQYVKVQFNQRQDYLQLAEVEVISRVVTATPEPASLVLFATGLVALGGVAARRRKTT